MRLDFVCFFIPFLLTLLFKRLGWPSCFSHDSATLYVKMTPACPARVLPPKNATLEEGDHSKKGLELVKAASDKHLDLLRPSTCYFSMTKEKEPTKSGGAMVDLNQMACKKQGASKWIDYIGVEDSDSNLVAKTPSELGPKACASSK